MSGTVLTVSGGLDSVTLAHELSAQGAELTLLSFDYGQRHARELRCAAACGERLGAPFHVVDIGSVGALLSGSALTDPSVDVPDGHYTDLSMRATVVPNRNAIFLSIATGLAVALGAGTVATAVHAGDHPIYPDCRPEFVDAFDRLARVANEGFGDAGLQVVAPFLHLDKSEVVARGARLGVPFEQTWSCYRGGDIHCGRCGTCVERREAFVLAGVDDPTPYDLVAVVMFTISKRFAFSASHLLEGLAEGHPCARLHGHNYEVEVVAAAADLDPRGFVVDYHDFAPLKTFIDRELDHQHLNDVLPGQPSAERIAWWLFEWCKGHLGDEVAGHLVAVRVSETPAHVGRVPAQPLTATLAVSEVFGPTFQGEGAFLGQRAGFVRLARCNLDCRWCDTPYTWDWNRFDPAAEIAEMAVDDVLHRLDEMAVERVVITGGEPLLQQRRLVPLLEAAAERRWSVEVETNGTVGARARRGAPRHRVQRVAQAGQQRRPRTAAPPPRRPALVVGHRSRLVQVRRHEHRRRRGDRGHRRPLRPRSGVGDARGHRPRRCAHRAARPRRSGAGAGLEPDPSTADPGVGRRAGPVAGLHRNGLTFKSASPFTLRP